MKKLLLILLLSSGLSSTALTLEQVWQEINYCELKHPEIVMAQTIKEAGWEYDSHNATKRHNLLGLKDGNKTEFNKYGYKIFDHWTESISDYKERIQNRYKEGEDYFKFLVRIGYFQADPEEYINNLKWIIKELKRRGII